MAELLLCLPSALKTRFNASAWSNEYCSRFNCYAYGLNIPRAGRAHPGKLRAETNISFPSTRYKMAQALLNDGLSEITEKEALQGDFHVIAAWINGDDFHFIRRDSNDLWSEKMSGQEPVQLVGYDGRGPITDPRFAQSRYDIFCGYFAIPEKGILYLRRVDIPSPYLASMTAAFPK